MGRAALLVVLVGCGRIDFLPRDDARSDAETDAALDNGCAFFAVSTGRNQTCAIATGGDVWCWGDNDDGQLGAPFSDHELDGVHVPLRAPAVEVGTGKAFSCARLLDNTAWCWGNNAFGQLGNGMTTSSVTPVQVILGGSMALELEVGGEHACVRRSFDGAIVCWGRNKSNAINAAGDVSILMPQPIAGSAGAKSFVLGHRHGCGIDASDQVFCWGRGLENQLGMGTANTATPVFPTGLPTVAALNTSNRVTCMVAAGGVGVQCWGTRYLGGANFDTYPAGLYASGAIDVATSNYAACAVLPDSTATCWGYLYDETPAGLTTTPTPLANVTGITAIEGGWDHMCAITSSGLVCWGDDEEGQLGRGILNAARAPAPVAITCPP